jgi:hypothetical protein
MVGSEGRMKVTKGKVKRAVRKAVREHVVMAERLLREGDAVKDSEGVEIEERRPKRPRTPRGPPARPPPPV